MMSKSKYGSQVREGESEFGSQVKKAEKMKFRDASDYE